MSTEKEKHSAAACVCRCAMTVGTEHPECEARCACLVCLLSCHLATGPHPPLETKATVNANRGEKRG